MFSLSIDLPFIFVFVPIVLFFWYIFFREKNGISLPNPIIANFLKTPKSLSILWLLRAFLLVVLCCVGAGIHTSFLRFVSSAPLQETIIALDISRSMLAEESGISRLESSKQVIRQFVSDSTHSSFALIVFAGKPFLLVASSQDIRGIQSLVSEVSVDTIRQTIEGLSGTNIADALLLASESFGERESKKQIILITDGKKNLGSDPVQIATEIAKKGITIHTIALLSSDPSLPLSYTRPDGSTAYLQDENGEKIYGNTDSLLLQKIATSGNGRFFESKNTSELSHIFADFSDTSNKEIQEKHFVSLSLAPLFFILFLGVLFGERVYSRHLFASVYRGR